MDSTNASFSIEFYPPRTGRGIKLDAVHAELAALGPECFQTYGAGGSTRAGTCKLVLKYQTAGSEVAPHISFAGTDELDVRDLLQSYQGAGIKRLVALRGDIPSGGGGPTYYRYANELVEFIREETGDYFHIEVACYPETHPEAPTFSRDVAYFKQKVDAGANAAITQYFTMWMLLPLCRLLSVTGHRHSIVPGVMPITNFANLSVSAVVRRRDSPLAWQPAG